MRRIFPNHSINTFIGEIRQHIDDMKKRRSRFLSSLGIWYHLTDTRWINRTLLRWQLYFLWTGKKWDSIRHIFLISKKCYRQKFSLSRYVPYSLLSLALLSSLYHVLISAETNRLIGITTRLGLVWTYFPDKKRS